MLISSSYCYESLASLQFMHDFHQQKKELMNLNIIIIQMSIHINLLSFDDFNVLFLIHFNF